MYECKKCNTKSGVRVRITQKRSGVRYPTYQTLIRCQNCNDETEIVFFRYDYKSKMYLVD